MSSRGENLSVGEQYLELQDERKIYKKKGQKREINEHILYSEKEEIIINKMRENPQQRKRDQNMVLNLLRYHHRDK